MTNTLKTKSLDLAVDFIKQIFFLASGAIILSITLFKELFGIRTYLTYPLYLSWVLFILCIWLGLNALRWIIGHAAGESADLFHNKVSRNAKFCRYSFLAGIIALAVFAFLNISFASSKKVKSSDYRGEQIFIEIKGYDSLEFKPNKGQIYVYTKNSDEITLHIKQVDIKRPIDRDKK